MSSEAMAARYTLDELYKKRDEAYASGNRSETAKVMWAIGLKVKGKHEPKPRKKYKTRRRVAEERDRKSE